MNNEGGVIQYWTSGVYLGPLCTPPFDMKKMS